METNMAVFKNEEVRRTVYRNEWWFAVVDIVAALTGHPDPVSYWLRLKARVRVESRLDLSSLCRVLRMEAEDGSRSEAECANAENIFRIIQSLPAPGAEPLKSWLARLGLERIREIEDPEQGTRRTKTLYKLKGYSEVWIEKRMYGLINDQRPDESPRYVKREQDILAEEIKGGAKRGVAAERYLSESRTDNERAGLDVFLNTLVEANTANLLKSGNQESLF